jgi:hypothetical protein
MYICTGCHSRSNTKLTAPALMYNFTSSRPSSTGGVNTLERSDPGIGCQMKTKKVVLPCRRREVTLLCRGGRLPTALRRECEGTEAVPAAPSELTRAPSRAQNHKHPPLLSPTLRSALPYLRCPPPQAFLHTIGTPGKHWTPLHRN